MYFLHVVKTGGSTVLKHLSEHMPTLADSSFGVDAADEPELFSSHDLYYGFHKEVDDPEPRYIMIVRDPADWYLSVYHHDEARRNTGRSFEQWYEEGGVNTVIPQRTHRDRQYHYVERFRHEPLGLLDKLYWVTTTEHIDEDLPLLCQELGIPAHERRYRVAGEYSEIDGFEIAKRERVSEYMRKRIYAENQFDVRLWEAAKGKRWGARRDKTST